MEVFPENLSKSTQSYIPTATFPRRTSFNDFFLFFWFLATFKLSSLSFCFLVFSFLQHIKFLNYYVRKTIINLEFLFFIQAFLVLSFFRSLRDFFSVFLHSQELWYFFSWPSKWYISSLWRTLSYDQNSDSATFIEKIRFIKANHLTLRNNYASKRLIDTLKKSTWLIPEEIQDGKTLFLEKMVHY